MESITRYWNKAENFINQQLDETGQFLDRHPTFYKTLLVASHIFRSASMFALMEVLPTSPLVGITVMAVPTLLYRAGVERFCCFRFAAASCVGGFAIWTAKASLVSIAAGGAFATLSASLSTVARLAPLAVYLAYIIYVSNRDIEIYVSNRDIEKRLKDLAPQKKSCCSM